MKYPFIIMLMLCTATHLQAESLDPKSSLIIFPHLGSTVWQQQPVILGIVKTTAQKPEKNKRVHIYLDDKAIASVTTNNDGVWSYRIQPIQNLSNGFHTIQARVKSSLLHTFWIQDSMFLVDWTDTTSAYKAGTVSANNSSFNFPFDGSYVNTESPTIVGTLLNAHAHPVAGETITILLDTTSVGTTTSDSNGVFSLTLNSALSNDSHTLSGYCIESQIDLPSVNFTIDTATPATPTITSPSVLGTVSGSFTVTGTSEPYATIATYLDNDPYGQVCYADETGAWSIDYTASVGTHTLIAQATDLAGNQSSSTLARIFTVVGS